MEGVGWTDCIRPAEAAHRDVNARARDSIMHEAGNIADQLVHLGRPANRKVRPVNLPMDFASTYVFDTLADFEAARAVRYEKGQINYGRYGTESTFALEEMVANLEGGHGAIAVSSGLTAVTMAILPFVGAGRHILVADTVYGPTRHFCDDILARMGVATTYYDPLIGAGIADLVRPETALIFLESPGSNTFEVQDVRGIADVARRHGIVTVIDNTWATPVNFRPITLGVDVSVHAGTKYLSGHSDVMIGLIVATKEKYDVIRRVTLALGERASPAEIFLTLRGLRTLALRMERHGKTAVALAKFLRDQPQVARVLHPALPECSGHEIWKRDFSGSSGVFSFVLKPCDKRALAAFVDGLELFGIGLSWGGYESLILPADVSASRSAVPFDAQGWLVRISAGLEDEASLIADLRHGLARLAT
jgi:cysteine-S-conjugate beta-lyase